MKCPSCQQFGTETGLTQERLTCATCSTPQTVGMTVILLKSVYPSDQVINHTHRLGVPIKPDAFIIIGV
ncbi:uncharacterized protein N7518_007079 [Penicillium psychrosexuale]|uniref:uncharacterized protein n=1 Tax=Penicillium psychrosexuale TaxID=1002107 RepID=UPI002544E499|nr:uncharacterized protein N7518_007079 [Penicillium psychrosexuale]KAJ5790068.1 hypothetical protein N7518_007079 [Penicillium psychrosexuale]